MVKPWARQTAASKTIRYEVTLGWNCFCKSIEFLIIKHFYKKNTIYGDLSKIAYHFNNRVIQKLMSSKNVNNRKCAPKLIVFNEKENWEIFLWFLSRLLYWFTLVKLHRKKKCLFKKEFTPFFGQLSCLRHAMVVTKTRHFSQVRRDVLFVPHWIFSGGS